MSRSPVRSSVVALAVATAGVVSGVPSPADEPPRLETLPVGQWVFVGTVTVARPGPVNPSDPPIYHYELGFKVTETLRGRQPDVPLFRYSIRQKEAPTFQDGPYLVAVKQLEDRWVVSHLSAADAATVERARALARLPVGWRLTGDNRPLSPWAPLRDRAWPAKAPKPKGPQCAACGRPALFVGDAVSFRVEQVPPAEPRKYQNDYGDGKFRVTLTNTSDRPVTVPALLTDGRTIFWEDSLFLMTQSQPHLLLGAGRATAARPVELKPGESVSTEIDTLLAEGVDWPRGGQRVYFDFVLGEKSVPNFFYYFSRLHDPMREEARRRARDGGE